MPSLGIQSKHRRAPDACLGTLRVTVLAGGPGAEREVSLQSGAAVAAALRRRGHAVSVCDVRPGELSALDLPADFVFVALHGEFGEDGAVQAELDRRGLVYSGTGAAGSRLAMHKVEAKRAFQRCGVPTPSFAAVDRGDVDDEAALFPVPAVVKPVDSGSSVNVTIARTRPDLRLAARRLVEEAGGALLERYIQGREWTVGLLGEEALPVCEIRTRREFYDYQAKYVDEDTEYDFDFPAPPGLTERVQRLSVTAHRALGCDVFSRVDWMIDGATNEPYALEVNTIPGFTGHSLLPKAAARVGVGFDELCERIIELSLSSKRGG